MVTLLGWKPSKYRRVAARVSVTPYLLPVNNLDGAVKFILGLWLLDPVALWKVFVCPTNEVRSNHLRNSAAHAASLFDIKIPES